MAAVLGAVAAVAAVASPSSSSSSKAKAATTLSASTAFSTRTAAAAVTVVVVVVVVMATRGATARRVRSTHTSAARNHTPSADSSLWSAVTTTLLPSSSTTSTHRCWWSCATAATQRRVAVAIPHNGAGDGIGAATSTLPFSSRLACSATSRTSPSTIAATTSSMRAPLPSASSTTAPSAIQCIHFLRSERCPPTSTSRNLMFSISNTVSNTPVVFTRTRSRSSSFGMYSSLPIRATSSKKYFTESSSWMAA
mmetsp:Transcript_49718/g.122079  ORF Transcript_49718/g.122079 Transcript_49718/m.122079 type:complete len:252 (+) Transcript_49718:933-1688(+)